MIPDSSTSASGAITVGAVTTVVLAEKTGRIGLVLCNDSDEAMYLAFGASAVMNSGTRLNANGGTILLDNALMSAQAINAICASGGKVLTYTEFYN